MEPDEQLEGDGQPAASEVNRELTETLVDVGRRMGFTTVTEYDVPGGRLDVVWLWDPPSPIPALSEPSRSPGSRSGRTAAG